jgi:4-oxalocrotonate tautomerase
LLLGAFTIQPLRLWEEQMPLAQIYIGPGRSQDEMRVLIEKVTRAITDALGPLKQPVWVIVNEVPLADWGVGGKPIRPPAG